MAVDLNKFKKKTEKRLPILFLVEESGYRHVSADLVKGVLRNCLEKNIHAEFMLLSFGLDWTLRYPKLKDNSPYFARLEEVDLNSIVQINVDISEAKQTFLSSALDLSKAILEDTETTKLDRYKPVIIIAASRIPAKGWENSLDALLNDGRSSNAQVYWINYSSDNINSLINAIEEMVDEQENLSPKTNNPVKKFKKVIFKDLRINMDRDADNLAKEIVSSFKLEPLDEIPEEPPVEFDVPGIGGSFGDGTDAKGDGIV